MATQFLYRAPGELSTSLEMFLVAATGVHIAIERSRGAIPADKLLMLLDACHKSLHEARRELAVALAAPPEHVITDTRTNVIFCILCHAALDMPAGTLACADWHEPPAAFRTF
jgi:hypothetical protein